jgi:hypothetical protein
MSEIPQDLRNYLVDAAIQIGKNSCTKLDFSDGSVAQVEDILRIMGETYEESGDDEGLRGIALAMAAYIIAVVEKTGPIGSWERDHPEAGEYSFPYYWNEGTLFPVAWCLRKIFNVGQVDIWVWYKSMVIDRRPT